VRLVRIVHDDAVRIGVEEDEGVAVLDASVPTIARALSDLHATARAARAAPRVAGAQVRRLAPIDPDARIFCVAQNYRSHAREVAGTDAPPAPVVFLKPTSALVGPEQHLELAPVTQFLDYEAEMAVVVGGEGRALEPAAAEALVVAATCFNDGSARDLQPAELGGKPIVDWFSGKSLDRSGAIGPWLAVETAGDLGNRRLACRVNDEVVQDDTTASMVFTIGELLAFISHRLALRPGDVLATGTPGGVGAARGVALAPGDRVEVELEGVGVLGNTVVAA